MIIESLFPTPLLITKLNRNITDNEKQFIKDIALSVRNNISNSITTSNNVLDNNELKDIKEYIETHIQEYKQKIISPRYDNTLYITESWINYTNKNQSHHRHSHDNSLVSGVFYFNTVENDAITFYKKKSGLSLSFDTETANVFNSLSYRLPVSNNMLILFPSELEHEVDINIQDKTRISLSFNVFVKGVVSNVGTTKLTIN
jgi:uncharacterized protein (TIGR02466 family)